MNNGLTRKISCFSELVGAFWCVNVYAIVSNTRKAASKVRTQEMTRCIFDSAKISEAWEPTVKLILEMESDSIISTISSLKEGNLLDKYIALLHGFFLRLETTRLLTELKYYSEISGTNPTRAFHVLCEQRLSFIFTSARYWGKTPDEVTKSLNDVRDELDDDISFRSILLKRFVLKSFASITSSPFNSQPVGQRSNLCFAVVVQFYIDMFKDQENPLILVKEGGFLDKIPVELWSSVNKIKQLWEIHEDKLSERTKELQKALHVPLKIEIDSPFLILQNKLNYRTEREQARLLEYCGHKHAKQYSFSDKIYSDWLCALLRTWIKIFGPEDLKTQSEVIAENTSYNLWSFREGMFDGELLHIAVEVKSLIGVKDTAWPGLLRWKNNNGNTAREVSLDLWGPDDEITKFLTEREGAAKIIHDVPDS